MILPHGAHRAQRQGPKNEFFYVISVLSVVKYFFFSRIWRISWLKTSLQVLPLQAVAPE
jgi:hypothetical protein